MNRQRRARLAEAHNLLVQALDILTEVEDEERAAFYALPEGLAASDRGQKLEENADSLGNLCIDLDNAISELAGM